MQDSKNNDLGGLEQIADTEIKKTGVSAAEYAGIGFSTEIGAYIGANAGLFSGAAFTESSALLTGSLLTGDYVAGTLAQVASYWYYNSEKFKDESGILWGRAAWDFGRLLVYDVPVTAASYVVSGYIAYTMLENHCDKAWVAACANGAGMAVWHSLNYFVYSAIKGDTDTTLIKRLKAGIASLIKSAS